MPAQDFLKEQNMAKFCPLFSSSSGNCIYIGTSDGGILIDAGVSAKRITSALDSIGVSPESIGAIFITHEHSDHVNGLRVFAGSRNIDVYASAGTLGALDSMCILNGKFTAHEIDESGAEAAGIGDITGSIEEGKCADMIVTKNNPLDDLRALEKVETVIARGKIYDRQKVKVNKRVKAELDKFL